MPTIEPFEVVKVKGLRYEERRRGVGFLKSNTPNKEIDALKVYEALTAKKRQDLLNRFDYWMDEGVHDQYFHGWPNEPEHKNCFSFRWTEGKIRNRLYGFLYLSKGYSVCILISHGAKTQEHTDPAHKKLAERLIRH